MDILTLAMSVIHVLAPLGPILAGIGGALGVGIVNKVGENLGDDAYNQVKEEGKRLYQVVEERFDKEKSADTGSSSRALQNFIYEPDTYRDIFQKKLVALFKADPTFADRVSEVLSNSLALQQVMRGGNQSVLRNNEQTNSVGFGKQSIEVGDGGTAESNKQIIKFEKPQA